jgi:sulfite reductase (NADPH) hemoprotein beta-component
MAKSRNEDIKDRSNFLRGGIAEGLERQITGALDEDDTQLTKFHGIYQQDDRDLRPERGRKKMEKAFSFMARVRIPGGVVSPAQWLGLDAIADRHANGQLRLTTRQTVQFHHIIKSNLKPSIAAINQALLDTLAACGDVNRNVMCEANPYRSANHAAVQNLAARISAHLLPKTRAYHEIWLDGEQVITTEPQATDEEPIYGEHYLPRKFKIAIAIPPENDVDILTNDLGFVAIVEGGAIVGYDVTVGGGMGMNHGEADTFPRLADPLGFCTPDQAVAIAEAVVKAQRDHGNRSERKNARLKYTIERMGLDAFHDAVATHLGYRLPPPRGFSFTTTGDRHGWVEGEDGAQHLTLYIQAGRIADREGYRLRTALRELAKIHHGDFRITANQNLVIAQVRPTERPAVEALLAEHGITKAEGGLRLGALACVALPTCGLALAESERFLPELLALLEPVLEDCGLREDSIMLRMTGCPNGCARPYNSEIGLVGRGPGRYHLYLGAAYQGTRLNKLYRMDVDADGIRDALAPLFAHYAAQREVGEHFGDWAIRAGHVAPTEAGRDFHANIGADAAA